MPGWYVGAGPTPPGVITDADALRELLKLNGGC